jgi:hypothetical protein
MNNSSLFQRLASLSAIAAAPVAIGSWILLALAVRGDLARIEDMANVITLGAPAAGYFRAAWMLTDTFGYMLLLAPAVVYLFRWLKSRSPNLVPLSSFFALAYFLVGTVSVYLLAGLTTPLMRAYESAPGAEKETVLLVFQSGFDMVYFGIGPLGWLFGGLWWLSIGYVLRQERRILGAVTMILGLLGLAVWLEQAFHLQSLVVIETPFLFLVPVWSLWLGLVIWRRTGQPE